MMKRNLFTGLIAALCILIGYSIKPVANTGGKLGTKTIPYHGVLEVNGEAKTGSYKFNFKLSSKSNSKVDWTEEHPVVNVQNGRFSVNLGSITAFDEDDLNAADIQLEVLVNGVSIGNQPFNAVPYAIHAEQADDFKVKKDLTVKGDLKIDGNQTANGDLKVKGDQSVDGDQTVKGEQTNEGNLILNKDLKVKGNLEVEGSFFKNKKPIVGHFRSLKTYAISKLIGRGWQNLTEETLKVPYDAVVTLSLTGSWLAGPKQACNATFLIDGKALFDMPKNNVAVTNSTTWSSLNLTGYTLLKKGDYKLSIGAVKQVNNSSTFCSVAEYGIYYKIEPY